MTDEGYREIHLAGKQLVFVFMAATVVAVVIFLLGVLVGRGVRAERPGPEPTLVSAPQVIPDDSPAAADAAQAAPVDEGAAPMPPPADELSYPTRLDAKGQTPETLKPAPPGAASGTDAPPPAATPVPAPSAARPAPPQGDPAVSSSDDGFSVQIAAVKKRAEADAIVKRLQRKGYHAYVFTPPGRNPAAMFRVRVGSFKTREEAEAAAHRLEQEEQYKPWIIR